MKLKSGKINNGLLTTILDKVIHKNNFLWVTRIRTRVATETSCPLSNHIFTINIIGYK